MSGGFGHSIFLIEIHGGDVILEASTETSLIIDYLDLSFIIIDYFKFVVEVYKLSFLSTIVESVQIDSYYLFIS